MKIAPIDIAHKTFGRKMMGFDPDEVVDYLRSVADEMEELIRERNNLREQIREKDLAIIEFRERDELLKNTITTATKMSDKIQADSEREARLIINDANQKAEMIVSDARDSLKKIYTEVTDLKKLRMQFENNIRAIVQSHLTMLEQGHKVMPNPQIESQVVPASNLQTKEPRPAHGTQNSEEQEIRSNVADVVKRAAQLPNVDPL